MKQSVRPVTLVSPVQQIDHVRGPKSAKVTLIEYGDFECATCGQAYHAVKILLEEFGERMRFVFRHFPLREEHPHAEMAAEAAEIAGGQHKFWEMHDLLLREGAALNRAALDRAAQGLGLDMAMFKSSLNEDIYRQRIREMEDGAIRSHLRAAPGFFVNGRVCDVSGGMHALARAVAAAG